MSRLTLTIPAMLAASLAGLGASAAPAPTASAAPQVRLDFQKYTLPNGLEVILREDHRLPLVAVNLWYHVGPANETAGRTGFAHLFEHMMFQGSGHIAEDTHFKLLEGAGASMINGTTDFDRTNYMEDIPANQLELALWLESDRMGYLLDTLDQPKLSNQQDVVRNERRQSTENAPYGLVEEELFHQLFPAGHPYYASVIGSHADIQAAKLDDVRDFFSRYYAPNNASLAIVGDIDVAQTKALVAKYFAAIPRGPAVPPVTVTTPPISKERRSVVADKVELPRVYMAWLTPPIFSQGDAVGDLTARILGGGKASRLYKALVYDRKIAQSVAATQQSLMLGSVFQVTVTAKPGHTPEEIEKAIDEELGALATSGPTATDLDAARNALYSATFTSLENIGSFGGVANRLNMYNQFKKDPGWLNADLARYASVTPADVKTFAAQQLARDHRVVVHGVPGEKVIPPAPPTPKAEEAKAAAASTATKATDKEAWRRTQPQPGPAVTAKLPTPRKLVLDNGLTVYWLESHALPLVSGELLVRAGSAADPAALPGVAAFTASMLDEGTAKRDSLRIARDLEALGASLTTDAGPDGSFGRFRALKQNVDAVMEIVSDVMLAPAFPASEVERVRNDRITALRQRRDNPFQVAFRAMQADLYGAHPYGHIALGTEEALPRITRDDLVSFYRARYSPKNAALVLAGDLDEAEARRIATRAFGGWHAPEGGPTAAAAPAAPAAADSSRVIVIDAKGSPQTAVLVGQLGVKRSDPDFERLNVMNTVLGGLFSSRVNMNLREKHGYSYGAFSFIDESRDVGVLAIGAQVRTDVTGASVKEMLQEARTMGASEVSAEELRLAKDSIVRSLPALFETTTSAVGTIATLDLLDLPLDYYSTMPARVEAMTAADVAAATRRHLTPDRMVVVAVGDRATIDAQLQDAGAGPLRFADVEGKPLTK
jgi:zinc protease